MVVNSLILMLYCKELLMENKQRELKGGKKLESTVGQDIEIHKGVLSDFITSYKFLKPLKKFQSSVFVPTVSIHKIGVHIMITNCP